ncbi:hypothetical protein Cch01nite_44760 [Cellulomonas chitinilytica]|uniref:Uncharacterized protein n=1 Tax=Cellulomonas chitinilytica TaxID=398759 RepID=A0A919U4T0_9CELL|nr:hypothetical protein Cch01nite_44760 [Cellulomonas chitinilytica]
MPVALAGQHVTALDLGSVEHGTDVLALQRARRIRVAPPGEAVERVLDGPDLPGDLQDLGQAVLQRRVQGHRARPPREQLGVVRGELGAVRFLTDLGAILANPGSVQRMV